MQPHLVQRLVEIGNAYAIMGNDELDLLCGDAKNGSGWYFDERFQRDERDEPIARPNEALRKFICDFLDTLPVVLEREDLQLVHAVWVNQDIAMLRLVRGVSANDSIVQLEETLPSTLKASGSYQKSQEAVTIHAESQEDDNCNMSFLDAIADLDEACQKGAHRHSVGLNSSSWEKLVMHDWL